MAKRVYGFGAGTADGDGSMKPLLGGKGAGLAEMTRIGIPVPPGFTITTEVCLAWQKHGGALPEGVQAEIDAALGRVESILGASFGDAENPLLVSVRSGARQSMPGMMDTILNVGLNDETVEGLAARTGDPRFAWDSYRRFVQMFGDVVLGVHHFYFEEELVAARRAAGLRPDQSDADLSADHLKSLVGAYKALIRERSDVPFPEAPADQLAMAIRAVFASWNNNRAIEYRRMNDIPDAWGTAVNVQAMVFGNMGDDCATGVAFTRDPSTGEHVFYGEWLPNAQGEDVVAGIRTPQPLTGTDGDLPSLESAMPEAFAKLDAIQKTLERHYLDMQDLEFTIQRGDVWILQTRVGKRTAAAEVRIAVEMADEGLIHRDDALLRVDPDRIDALLHPRIDRDGAHEVIAKGLPASPGAATGALAFTAEEAEARSEAGESVILVRNETSPEDIKGMKVAAAILTARGGMTSHAAVVARQMGTCCVVGCGQCVIDADARTMRIGGRTFGPEDVLSVDGTTGEVIIGEVTLVEAQLTPAFERLMSWADDRRTIGVRTNADTGPDAATARRLGAEGIGLVRTEHMFFEGDRIHAMRAMILATTASQRAKALAGLRPLQQGDFEAIFEAMSGHPVTIRLLDPPLHEFLPERDADIEEIARRFDIGVDAVRRTIATLHESNPMLGHRGVRLGVTTPELYEMQARAIFDATLAARARGLDPQPEIMIPLVAHTAELKAMRDRIEAVRDNEYGADAAVLRTIPIGTMIELPRACVTADEIAEHAEFISFGTNDLTQTTYGLSRDDASGFLPAYIAAGLLEHDPFVVLDTKGVGSMIKIACANARGARPGIKVGICGEHGGEPRSVAWLQRGVVDYVSCSPYRVPIARLSAAQAAIRQEREPTS